MRAMQGNAFIMNENYKNTTVLFKPPASLLPPPMDGEEKKKHVLTPLATYPVQSQITGAQVSRVVVAPVVLSTSQREFRFFSLSLFG